MVSKLTDIPPPQRAIEALVVKNNNVIFEQINEK